VTAKPRGADVETAGAVTDRQASAAAGSRAARGRLMARALTDEERGRSSRVARRGQPCSSKGYRYGRDEPDARQHVRPTHNPSLTPAIRSAATGRTFR
jgi:hypothetical protein